MSGDALLSFGVEVEMILTPKVLKPSMTRYDIAIGIAHHYNINFTTPGDLKMLPIDEDSGALLKDRGYAEWGLVNDVTIMLNSPSENCKSSYS